MDNHNKNDKQLLKTIINSTIEIKDFSSFLDHLFIISQEEKEKHLAYDEDLIFVSKKYHTKEIYAMCYDEEREKAKESFLLAFDCNEKNMDEKLEKNDFSNMLITFSYLKKEDEKEYRDEENEKNIGNDFMDRYITRKKIRQMYTQLAGDFVKYALDNKINGVIVPHFNEKDKEPHLHLLFEKRKKEEKNGFYKFLDWKYGIGD